MLSRTRVAMFVTVALAFACTGSARADDDDEPKKEVVKEPKTEFGFVPVIGGDSDVGIGVGYVGSVTRLDPAFKLYRWRIESNGVITFKAGGDEGFRIPYQDYLAAFTFPNLAGGRVRLEIRPEFTNETTLKFYGLGNASKAPESTGPEYEYGRLHPQVVVRARVRIVKELHALLGLGYTHNWIDVHPNSSLSDARRTQGGLFDTLAKSVEPHGVPSLEYGLVYDTRDDETTTLKGQFHQTKIRIAPGGTAALPYRYAQVNAIFRGYWSPFGRHLTIAARVVGDFMFGEPPFYELPRYEDMFAIGGTYGVRGIPAQRYYGKIKVFGNFEVRTEFVDFKMFGKEFGFGLAAFIDGGRVWADWTAHPVLDGTGLGLKYGVGGGPRLRQGRTFIVRGDVAWSPDARPIGAYFAGGHAF